MAVAFGQACSHVYAWYCSHCTHEWIVCHGWHCPLKRDMGGAGFVQTVPELSFSIMLRKQRSKQRYEKSGIVVWMYEEPNSSMTVGMCRYEQSIWVNGILQILHNLHYFIFCIFNDTDTVIICYIGITCDTCNILRFFETVWHCNI